MTYQTSLMAFLAGTFGLSLTAFAVMTALPAAHIPEGFPGLPVWLVAVWSPTLVAIALATLQGEARPLLTKLIAFRAVGSAWWIVPLPIVSLLVIVLLSDRAPTWNEITPQLLMFLFAFNLILGPLGEEVGWRGFLQPALETRLHWVVATLVVAAIWAVWHVPLWGIESPQREIPFWAFCIHILAYSFLMASAGKLAPDTLIPAIALHLIINMLSGVVLYLGIANTAEWFMWSAPVYVVVAIVATLTALLR